MLQLDAKRHPALVLWFHELMRGPVTPYGDYFDRLEGSVAKSAPVVDSCAQLCL